MNKRIFYAAIAALLLFISGSSFAQATIDLYIMPLSDIDLGNVIVQNNLQGSRSYFTVSISPAGLSVYVTGEIYWDKNDGRGFKKVYEFKTNKFISRNFSSEELGSSGISIATSKGYSDQTDELLSRGKPTGTFRFVLVLYSAIGAQLSQTSKDVTFSNPAQTLSIITPEANSSQPVGSVIASWNAVSGVQKYQIKLNVRTSPSQSLEEALNSGTPLINNKDVSKDLTSVNLRELLEREWLPGQELVLQVAAITQGIGGGTELRSNLISFTIARGAEPVDNNKTALINLLNQMQNEKASQFIGLLNNVPMSDIKFYNNEGNEISFQQFQALVSSILTSITKINLINQ